MDRLREAAADAAAAYNIGLDELPSYAVRFVRSQSAVGSVLVGVSNESELEQALLADAAGDLPEALLQASDDLGLTDGSLLNPANWDVA